MKLSWITQSLDRQMFLWENDNPKGGLLTLPQWCYFVSVLLVAAELAVLLLETPKVYRTKLFIPVLITIAVCALVVLYLFVFGFDAWLSLITDFVPIAITLVTTIMTLKPLKEERKKTWIPLLIVAGFAGTGILSLSRIRNEGKHQREVRDLQNRMDSVGNQNGQLLSAFLAKPTRSSQEAEMERRQNIQKALRSEYILSHSNVSPGLLAGTEFPPDDWMNKRLKELGEAWAVTSPAKLIAPSPPTRSYLVFDGGPRFGGRIDEKGNLVSGSDSFFILGDDFALNYYLKANGPNPITVTFRSTWLDSKADYSLATQKQVISEYQATLATEIAKLPKKIQGRVWMPGEAGFNTAFAYTPEKKHRFVTQDDIDSIKSGTEIVFLVIEITYFDNKQAHHLRACEFLQPPGTARIWHSCEDGVLKQSD